MEKEYVLPEEPTVPLYDKENVRWDRSPSGLWISDVFLPQMWTGLLRFRAPLTTTKKETIHG